MRIEQLIAAEAEAAERNPDVEIRPGSKVTRGHSRTRTLQVRLNDDEFAVLAAAAEQRGVPASTLARELLMSQLASPASTPQAVIARMRADLDALASSVA
ncbi:MAG: CopG family transcriptional regulator [Actinomycetota bacterium]